MKRRLAEIAWTVGLTIPAGIVVAELTPPGIGLIKLCLCVLWAFTVPVLVKHWGPRS